MEKPIKPKNPSRNQSPPSPVEEVYKVLMERSDGSIGFCSFDNYENVDGWEDKFIHSIETVKYSHVLKIKELLPKEVKDFEIDIVYNCNGYFYYTYISYKLNKAADVYNEELKTFNDRFNKYNQDLLKYEQDLRLYQEFNQDVKIRKLEEQINKLKVKNG